MVVDLPEVGEVAGAVAHRVGVLAVDVGLVEGPGVHTPQGLLARVHRPDDVGVGAAAGVAEHDRTHLLLGLQGLVALLEIGAESGFVAQGEDDHAGVVLGALVHAEFALQHGRVEAGVARHAAPAVALDVGLAADIESVLVAELVEAALLGIVARADGVDVVLLHQLEVAAHQLLGHDVAGVGGVLMDVDALDHHALSVDEEVGALHAGRAEADPRAGVFGVAVGAREGKHGGVEVGLFGAPGLHVLHDMVEADHLPVGEVLRGRDGGGLGAAPDLAAARVEQAQGQLRLAGLPAGHGQLDAEVQHAVAEVRAQGRVDDEVADEYRRTGRQVDVALDAADAPEVLALIVTA